MADYKAMYLAAMDAMEQAVRLLIEAQRRRSCCVKIVILTKYRA